MRIPTGGLVLGLLATGLLSGPASAFYLDKARNFDVRMRAYSQLGIMTEDSENDACDPVTTLDGAAGRTRLKRDPRLCAPKYDTGDLGQHRNFYNPEFDAKLTDYTKWMNDVGMSWLAPDDFKFRFAWWGFYDGTYDYLDSGIDGSPTRWNQRRQNYKARFAQSTNPNNESFRFNDENKNPRKIYASRNRINELYFDYTKGPFFLRVGRQAISWGEADTIALLDVSNPFDLTLGAPGLFQDVDEARIPLWTIRSTLKLVDNWKWLSSLFLDTYLVPGIIDTTVPINPIAAGLTAFSPDQADPNANLRFGPTPVPGNPADPNSNQTNSLHTSVVDRLPDNTWGNSRWGARLTGVLARDYTVSAWYFRTYNQAPVPVLSSKSATALGTGFIDINGRPLKTPGRGVLTLTDDRGFRTPRCLGADGNPVPRAFGSAGRTPAGRACSWKAPVVTVLERDLNDVIGVAGTWFSPMVNGIIRAEAEYFNDELAFIPEQNLNSRSQIPQGIRKAIGDKGAIINTAATADYVRWVIGYDRFFFFRPLNPSNSFTLSASFNNFFNLSEKGGRDYRNPQAKPGKLNAESGPIAGVTGCQGAASRKSALCVRTVARNFEDAYQWEGFIQTALISDYLHGKLSPRLIMIADFSGIITFVPSVTYRFTDSFLGSLTYININSTDRRANAATFRAHDMVQLRLTYQLN